MKRILTLITTLLLAPLASLHAAAPKLNVLLILSDDHSYPHVGCYGNKGGKDHTEMKHFLQLASLLALVASSAEYYDWIFSHDRD